MEGKEMEEEVVRDMTPRLVLDLGTRYPTEKSIKKYRYGLYECAYCKKEFEAMTKAIKSGHTKSCGCQKGNITHGLCNNKFYKTWHNMNKRCNNPEDKDYLSYGGRGIKICDEWLDVTKFVAWAEKTYPNIEDATLDRIDNNKGYSPENCRWVDKTTQILNRRIMKNNKSGYVGVIWNKRDRKWIVNIGVNNKLINIGTFKTKEEAVQARDNYIIENNLPHKLSTQY